MSSAPLIMHVVYRFSVGGLENGVVNLINRLPRDQFRHAIVSLTNCDERFCRRIELGDVEFISLNKPAGHGFRLWRTVWRLFRRYHPAVVHTRNLAALEMQVPAWLAGVPIRLHGEHGRDVSDPDGRNRRHRMARRLYAPFVTGYVAVSRDLQHYLCDGVGIDAAKVRCICNGVDERRFVPVSTGTNALHRAQVVVGCVGRLQPIKGHTELLRAVALLLARSPQWRGTMRMQLIGDGPLRAVLEQQAREAGIVDVVEFLGERDDVAERMQDFDVFVMPSLAEGISNTILEAMASGLPVVATAVGGNGELVTDGETGFLVPPSDASSMAAALERYLGSAELRQHHGRRAREIVERQFSLSGMVDRYRSLYADALDGMATGVASSRA